MTESPEYRLQLLSDVVVGLQNDLWNNKKYKVIDDNFSPDVTNIYPGIITTGRDDLKTKFLLPLFTAFPDLKWVSLEVMGDTGSIATRWTLSGTFKKPYLGYQPNNQRISWQGISIMHVANGLITSARTIFDTKPFFEALSKEGSEESK
eukprot:TRINITY_DN14262_c0_g1_i4.p1 TRINITY_DN14262_c0_g1~~TRINITY_DN14262_c0_g1_i4.p1  ORF type:complete len:149 (-),score=38.95 TRINITY_DN14262_c0_g1_i4:118-564(-)